LKYKNIHVTTFGEYSLIGELRLEAMQAFRFYFDPIAEKRGLPLIPSVRKETIKT
jgi:hypothetical protein